MVPIIWSEMQPQKGHPGSPQVWLGLVAVASAVLVLSESPARAALGKAPTRAEVQATAQWLVTLAKAVRSRATAVDSGQVWYEGAAHVGFRAHATRSRIVETDRRSFNPNDELPPGVLNLPPPVFAHI